MTTTITVNQLVVGSIPTAGASLPPQLTEILVGLTKTRPFGTQTRYTRGTQRVWHGTKIQLPDQVS